MVGQPHLGDRAGEAPQPPGSGHEVGFPVFMALEQRIAAGMAFWAATHGLVALLIARPPPYFPWEDADDLVRTQTEILPGGLLVPKGRGC